MISRLSKILKFSTVTPPPLRLAAGEYPPRPRPPYRHHHGRLAASYQSVPTIGTGAAAVVAGDGDFAFGFRRRRHPFGPFSGAGEPPSTDPTAPTAFPCRDLHFETSHDHHHGRDRRRRRRRTRRRHRTFSAGFRPAIGRTPPVDTASTSALASSVDPDRRRPQPRRRRRSPATGTAAPVCPVCPFAIACP